MKLKSFGAEPCKKRRARFQKSPHYRDGAFHNLTPTPFLLSGASVFHVAMKLLLPDKTLQAIPNHEIIAVRTNLHTLADESPTVVWFGHSSYLIKYQGKNILVDPVFSGHASPVPYFAKAFAGTNIYTAADMPPVDLLIITHDHYDHLDYRTILALKGKVARICTPLGVGAHLESWGIAPELISEMDWWETAEVLPGLHLTATPAQHFSGRGLSSGKTLWASFVLELDNSKIFIGGDSGYDRTFEKIFERFGSFDLACLECGQYNEKWPLIHSFPEQTAQAAKDLHARLILPVHWGKFQLSLHSWTEPVERIVKSAGQLGIPLATPRIGEPFSLGHPPPQSLWWASQA